MLNFADHALDRVRERGITPGQVEYAWSHPTGPTLAGARPDTQKFTGRTSAGTDLVIVVARDDRRRIISVWVR